MCDIANTIELTNFIQITSQKGNHPYLLLKIAICFLVMFYIFKLWY